MTLHIPPALWDERYASELLRCYWGTCQDGFPAYTGSRFERLAGGGDHAPVASRFTSDDVVAVAALSVTIPHRAAMRILEPRKTDPFSALLARIPTDTKLAEADVALIGPDSPAQQLWKLLCGIKGIKSVTAGKLLARKRPHLLPVYDKIIKRTFARKANDQDFWSDLQTALTADNGRLTAHLLAARDSAGIGEDISTLRVLDSMAWLHGKNQERSAP